jgi:hypothetical protein
MTGIRELHPSQNDGRDRGLQYFSSPNGILVFAAQHVTGGNTGGECVVAVRNCSVVGPLSAASGLRAALSSGSKGWRVASTQGLKFAEGTV